MGSSSGSGLGWVVGLGALAALWWFSTKFVRDIAEAVEDWEVPSNPKSEAFLRTSLARHLRRTLPATVAVIEEYGSERSRADIAVLSSSQQADEYTQRVAIELKLQLSRKRELDRLIGQTVGYRSAGYDRVLVVSVDPEPNLLEVLKNRAATEGLSGFMMVTSKTPIG